jgi:predicted ATP-dependent serine protease
MFAPPPIRFSKKCKRCGLRYPRKEIQCVHCSTLTDVEVDALLQKKKKEHKTSASIGKLFIYIAILIIIGFAIIAVS